MFKNYVLFSLFLLVRSHNFLETPSMLNITTTNCIINILKTFNAQDVLIFYFNDDDFPMNVIEESNIPIVSMNLQLDFKLKKYFQVDFYMTVLNSSSCLESLLKRIYRKFHPKTKFIIVYSGTSEVDEVFRVCLQYRIVNVVLILGSRIFTYLPYRNGDCGTNFQPELIGSCENGTNVDGIFPDKAPLVLNDCSLRLLALHLPPYVTDENNITNPGLEVAIVREVCSRMQMSIYFQSHSQQSFGHKSPQEEYSGLYLAMFSSEADLMFGNLRMNSSYIGDFSFTLPHVMDQVTWHVRASGPAGKWKNLTMIFRGDLWLALGVSIVVTTATWFTLARRADHYSAPMVCALATLYVLLQGSVRKPFSHPLRLAFIAWTCLSLLLYTAFQSQLISLLTRTIYEEQVSDTATMIAHGFDHGFYHSLRDLFNEPDDALHWRIYNTYTHCPFLELDCIDRAARDHRFAVLKNRRQIRYLTTRYLFPDGRKRLYSFELDVFYYPLSMMMAKDHPLLNRINSLLTRMQENGLIARLDNNLSDYREPVIEQSPSILTFDHLRAVFFIYAIGIVLSAMVFILEYIFINITKMCKKLCIKCK